MKLKKYSKYKDSGIDWIGKTPEDWEIRKLSQCFDLIGSGTTPTSGDETYHANGTINWLLTGDLNDGYITKTSKKVTIKAMRDYSALKLHPENSLVIAMYGATIGKIGLTKIKTTMNQACCVLNKSKIFKIKFMFYWFLANKKEIISLSYGGGQPNISQDIIKYLKIQTPSIEEQGKIIVFLDIKTSKIENLIEKDKKIIELLKEKRTSLINKAVIKASGWKLNKFKHLFNFSKGLSITKENLEDEGIPCVNYGEIHSKYGFELDPEINLLKCVNEDYLKTSRKSLLKKGDFIFADTSEDLEGSGNFTYLNSDIKTFAGYHTVIARHIGNINHRFLAYFCDSELFRCQIRKVVKGVKVYSITNDILKNTLVWYPIREEQDQIVEFLDKETGKIDNHIKKVEEKIELYEEYKKSVIYSVVTGKVEV